MQFAYNALMKKSALKDACEVLAAMICLPAYAFKEALKAWREGDHLTAIYAMGFLGLLVFVIWQTLTTM